MTPMSWESLPELFGFFRLFFLLSFFISQTTSSMSCTYCATEHEGKCGLFLDAVSDLLLEDLSSHNSSIVG